jgi:hypothetical protein
VLPDEPAFATVAGAKLLSLARAWRLHGRARTTRLFLKRFLEEKSGDKSGGYEN